MKTKIVLGLFFLLFSVKTQAQKINNRKKDSLLLVVETQENSKKLLSLDKLFNYYINNYSDSAEIIAQKMLQISSDINDIKFKAISYNHIGQYLFRNNLFLRAEENFNRAVEIQKQNNLYEDLAETYKNLSRVNYYNNNLEKSIDYTLKSLHIFENLNNTQGITETYINLGTLQSATGNFRKALSYYFTVEETTDSLPDKTKVKLYHNIGSQYKRLGIADSAVYFYKKSLSISKLNNFIIETASNYFSLGEIYGNLKKQKDSSLLYLNKALKVLGNNNLNLQKAIYASIGKTYFEARDYKKSFSPLIKSLEISEKLHNLNGKEIAHFYLYKSNEVSGNFKKALYHHIKYTEAKDSIKYNESEIKLENLQSKYENDKNILKIEKLELKQKTDKKIKKLLLFALFLLIIVFILIIRSFILKRKKNILKQELLKIEKEKLNQDLKHKTRELTTQALMMLQKNKLITEVLTSISEIKTESTETNRKIYNLKRLLKNTIQSEKDWDLFKQYFEQINKYFYSKLKQINPSITPSEQKLAALIKLRFSIKETSDLLNISFGSVKTARYNLRKKLELKREDNLYDFLNEF